MRSRAVVAVARRLAIVVSVAISIVIAAAAPAWAHNAAGPRPTNYLTTIDAVAPRIAGLTIRVADLGNKLQLTNRTSTDVFVLGYDGEPYLRIGPRGVYENLRSPATYLNRTRLGTTPVPPIAIGTGASTPPVWHRVSGGRTAIWHDHRIHWMGLSPPPVVQQAPGRFHVINPQWTVVLRDGNHTVAVQGQLVWIPGPSGRPWLPFLAALLVVGFAVGLSRRAGPAIAVLVVLVGVDLAHTVGAEAARPGTQLFKTVQFFGDNFVSVIVWIAAAGTIWALHRRRVEAPYGVLLVGAMMGLAGGTVGLSALWKSQLPTVEPYLLERAQVAVAFGLGLGVAAGALVALRRSATKLADRDASDPRWVERLIHGLDASEVDLLCKRLDAEEVIPLVLTDLAQRATPLTGALDSGAVVFVVLAQDDHGEHVWSITADSTRSGQLRVQPGRAAPTRAELRTTFPTLLALVAGTVTLEQARASGQVIVDDGDDFLVALGSHFSTLDVSVAAMATC